MHEEDGTKAVFSHYPSFVSDALERLSPTEKRFNVESCCYHEAGHAVFAWRHHVPTRCLEVEDDGTGFAGINLLLFPGDACEPAERDIVTTIDVEIAQAGWLAERHWHGRGGLPDEIEIEATYDSYVDAVGSNVTWPGIYVEMEDWWDDVSAAVCFLTVQRLAGDLRKPPPPPTSLSAELIASVTRDFLEIQARIRRELQNPQTWSAIDQLARALMQHRYLGLQDIEQVIESVNPPRGPLAWA